MLEPIYETLKEDFEKKRDAFTDTGGMPRFVPPTELDEAEVDTIINETNNLMADAADNNDRAEVHAASRKANLIMSMARDNHSATRTRMQQIRNFAIYVDRALFEADPEDVTQSDGMLLAGIRRVDL